MLAPFTTDFAILILTASGLGFALHKLGQPTIVAYILTGVLLGPAMFNAVGESELITLLGELGLGFLLFFVGIEMNFREIEDIFSSVARIGVYQTLMQTALAFLVAALLGFTTVETIIISLCTVFGATPVIVKLLDDKGELTSLPGRLDVGVLVLQDIYIIVLLALFNADSLNSAWVITASLLKIIVLIAAIGGLAYFSSKHVLPTLFQSVANNKHAFFIHGIAWAFLFISLSMSLDLSVEIGAFFAGLGLGQMPFQSELKERVRPLTTFFIVVFFSSIGLQLTWQNLTAYWVEALIGGAALMIGNFFIMYYLFRRESFSDKTSFLGSINMTQTSEFSLVVGSLAVAQGYVANDILGYLSVMAIATMTTSSVFIYYNQSLYERLKPWLPRTKDDDRQDKTRYKHTVFVGFDDAVKSLLPALDDDVLIVDNDSSNAASLRNSNYDYIYGNFFHEEMRGEANLKHASLVISVTPSFLINKHILRDVGDNTTAIVKASTFDEAAELYNLGADYVIVKDAAMAKHLGDVVETWRTDQPRFDEVSRRERKRVEEVLV